jgi:hypothetical protein
MRIVPAGRRPMRVAGWASRSVRKMRRWKNQAGRRWTCNWLSMNNVVSENRSESRGWSRNVWNACVTVKPAAANNRQGGRPTSFSAREVEFNRRRDEHAAEEQRTTAQSRSDQVLADELRAARARQAEPVAPARAAEQRQQEQAAAEERRQIQQAREESQRRNEERVREGAAADRGSRYPR